MTPFLVCFRVFCWSRVKQTKDVEHQWKASEVKSAKPRTLSEGIKNLGNERAMCRLFPGCSFSPLFSNIKKQNKTKAKEKATKPQAKCPGHESFSSVHSCPGKESLLAPAACMVSLLYTRASVAETYSSRTLHGCFLCRWCLINDFCLLLSIKNLFTLNLLSGFAGFII